MKFERKYLSLPLTAQLEVTSCCNHRCVHCYNLDSNIDNRPSQIVSDDIVISCAKKLIEYNIFGVVITGGEPLIKKNLTKQLISLFREHQIKVNLNSNAILLDDEMILFLKNNNVGVLTSCPSGVCASYNRIVGVNNYDKFVEKIRKMTECGVRYTVNMVVTKENLHEIIPTAQKLKELGCSSFAATPMALNVEYPRLDLLLDVTDVKKVVSDLLWIKDNIHMKIDILEALPKCVFELPILKGGYTFLNRRCQAGRTAVAVSCDGEVRPCAHNPISYGNLLKTDLREIWKNMKDWRSEVYVPFECKDCACVGKCNGGCRTTAKTYRGKWDSKDVWCTGKLDYTIPDAPQKVYTFNEQTKICLKDTIKIRPEGNGIYLLYNVTRDTSLMVNQVFYNFIVDLLSINQISYNLLCKKYGLSLDDQHMQETLSILAHRKFINIEQ